MNDFAKINKDIKDNLIDKKKIIVFRGTEEYIINSFLNKIKEKYLGEMLDISYLTPEKQTNYIKEDNIVFENKFKTKSATNSFFQSKKIVIVKDFENISGFNMNLSNLIPFVSTNTIVIVIINENLIEKRIGSDVGDELYFLKGIKSIKKYLTDGTFAIYNFFKLDGKTFRDFILSKIKEYGACLKTPLQFEKNEFDYFIYKCGYFDDENVNLEFVDEVLKKIIFSAKIKITKEGIDFFIEERFDVDVFSLINKLIKKDKSDIFKTYLNMNENGVSIFSILALLIPNFSNILGYIEAKNEGLDRGKIAKRLGISEYRIENFIKPYTSKYSVYELREILSILFDIDYKIKSGLLTEIDAFLIFLLSYVKI